MCPSFVSTSKVYIKFQKNCIEVNGAPLATGQENFPLQINLRQVLKKMSFVFILAPEHFELLPICSSSAWQSATWDFPPSMVFHS